MRTEPGPQSNSYIRQILQDGTKPFRYRCRVRSLLGFPDGDEKRMAFSTSNLPVGFRYTQPSSPAATSPDASPLDEIRESSLLPHESVAEPTPAREGQTRRDQNRVVQPVQSHDLAPAPTGDDGGTIPAPAPREEVREHTSLTIPGASMHSPSFPTLSQARLETEDTPPLEQNNEDESQPLNPSQPLNTTMPTSAGAHAQARENTSAIREIAAFPQKIGVEPAQHGLTGTTTVAAETAVTPAPEAPRRLSSPAVHDAGEHLPVGDTSRASRRTTASIEQLRRATRELAAKVTSPTTEPSHQTSPQPQVPTPPQPIPQVVVLKRTTPQPRTRCAFWERRYLGRLQVRPLR